MEPLPSTVSYAYCQIRHLVLVPLSLAEGSIDDRVPPLVFFSDGENLGVLFSYLRIDDACHSLGFLGNSLPRPFPSSPVQISVFYPSLAALPGSFRRLFFPFQSRVKNMPLPPYAASPRASILRVDNSGRCRLLFWACSADLNALTRGFDPPKRPLH